MELLQKHFDIILETPDGIKKLRELILTLAIRGKLVRQDPNDQPVSELLREIETEKSLSKSEKEIKVPKPITQISDKVFSFEVPPGWQWVRLGDFTQIIRGITFPSGEKTKEKAIGRIACLRTTNVQDKIEWNDLLFIDRKYMNNDSKLLKPNDIVISMANSRELVGKVAIIDNLPYEEATFGGFLSIIRVYKIEPYFLLYILRTKYSRSLLINSASQTTNIANISLGKLNILLVPIPPLDEQKRIIAKIEQLNSLCDTLELQLNLATKKRASIFDTILAKL
jgi:type I restriction enzyme S subunit